MFRRVSNYVTMQNHTQFILRYEDMMMTIAFILSTLFLPKLSFRLPTSLLAIINW